MRAEMHENLKMSGIMAPDPVEKVKKQNQTAEVFKRLFKSKTAVIGMVIVGIFLIIAIIGPLLAPYGYADMDISIKNQTPSAEHWLGTDDMGRDILSRLLVGTRYTLELGLGACVIGLVIGIILGCLAGFFGGWVEELIMRACDVMQAIPGMLLAIVISSALGNGIFNTMLAMCVGRVPYVCRMLRATFLNQRKLEYVEAAQAENCSQIAIMFKHILPNTISPLIVSTTMGIGNTITMAASLSYIGLGVQAPTPEWGAMLSAAKSLIRHYPHELLYPGLAIAILVLALNLFGDGLRDALDPKLKN